MKRTLNGRVLRRTAMALTVSAVLADSHLAIAAEDAVPANVNASAPAANVGSAPAPEKSADSAPATKAVFRAADPGGPGRLVDSLAPTVDEALWRRAKALAPDGRIRIHVSGIKAAADGNSRLQVVVSLLDADEKPLTATTRVRVQTSLGRLRTPGGEEAGAFDVAISGGMASLDLVAPITPGNAVLRATSGAVNAQGDIRFVPQMRPIIAVGIADFGFAAQHVSADPGAPAAAQLGFEDSLQHWGGSGDAGSFWSTEGRAAGFVKGTIAEGVLLTGAFDTNKVDPRRFFADVDPNQYFPVLGDASIVNYDARSTSRVYLRLDSDRGHVLYGDFNTLEAGRTPWLGSYVRTLTGLDAHYQGPLLGVDVFGAIQTSNQFVDEQPGRGISGPYAVSQANAIANSEIVELLVRDRNQPAVVVSRTLMVRYSDYDFEPFSGRILFRQPVPSVDANLNPVSIRITYEVDSGGRRYAVGGFDAQGELAPGLGVGARLAQANDPLSPYRLYGANSVWKIDNQTTLTVDAARSEGDQLFSTSQTGTVSPVGASGALLTDNPSGIAGRVDVVRHDERSEFAASYASAGQNFQNASANLSPGRTEGKLHEAYRLDKSTQVVVDALHSADESTQAHRNQASAGIEKDVWKDAKLSVGVNYVDQTYNAAVPAVAQYAVGAVPGTATGASLNNNGFGFLGGGLLGSPLTGALGLPSSGAANLIEQDYVSARVRLAQKVGERASVYGEYEHTLDGVSGQRAAVGGEYRFDESSRVYTRYEDIDSLTGLYGLGDGQRAHQAVLGADTSYMKDGTVYSEMRLAGGDSGQSVANAVGVRNLWHLAPGLNATTQVERQEVISPVPLANAPAGSLSGTQTATAIALGIDYTASPVLKTGGRLEYRFSDVQDTWLSTLAAVRKLDDDWSLIGRNIYLLSRPLDPALQTGTQEQDRMQVGFAYRDHATNRWNVLARYEYRTALDSNPLDPSDTHTQVLALVANYHPMRAWTYEGQVAAKRVAESVDGAVSGYAAQLFAGRVLWDFAKRWDTGLLLSTTTGGGAQDQGAAMELGYQVIRDFWVSGGVIAGRYADSELFSANSSWRGVYVHLRMKFDEKSLGLDKIGALQTPTP